MAKINSSAAKVNLSTAKVNFSTAKVNVLTAKLNSFACVHALDRTPYAHITSFNTTHIRKPKATVSHVVASTLLLLSRGGGGYT